MIAVVRLRLPVVAVAAAATGAATLPLLDALSLATALTAPDLRVTPKAFGLAAGTGADWIEFGGVCKRKTIMGLLCIC